MGNLRIKSKPWVKYERITSSAVDESAFIPSTPEWVSYSHCRPEVEAALRPCTFCGVSLAGSVAVEPVAVCAHIC